MRLKTRRAHPDRPRAEPPNGQPDPIHERTDNQIRPEQNHQTAVHHHPTRSETVTIHLENQHKNKTAARNHPRRCQKGDNLSGKRPIRV